VNRIRRRVVAEHVGTQPAARASVVKDRLVSRSLVALQDIRASALEFEATHARVLEQVAPAYRSSARNLMHYLSVRQRDIRPLQLDLHSLGLSSLGILERHTLASINAVLGNLEVLAGEPAEPAPSPPVDFVTGSLLLNDHTRRLFGPAPAARSVRIMVTMPSEAAKNPALVESQLRAGMDIMRINCAHDDAGAWRRMAEHLRRAERVVGRSCRIRADLAGPKLRTGPIEPVGHMVRIRPTYDALGRLLAPARAWLTPQDDPEPGPENVTVVPIARAGGGWRRARRLLLTDLRGRPRTLHVLDTTDRSLLVQFERKVHFAPGTALEARDRQGGGGRPAGRG